MIEDLRNHLAAHDKQIVFLFGAGTSSSVNIASPPPAGTKPSHKPLIPGIDGLTESCATAVSDIGPAQAEAWKALVEQCQQNRLASNVENILSNIRIKIDAIGAGESLVGLDKDELREIEKAISAAIATEVNPPESKIPTHLPHNDFAAWVKKVNRTIPLEIFTTNYDILFERAFEAERVPVFDGFVGTHRPFFYPECLDDEALLPTSEWIRLWKLHGSVNWFVANDLTGIRITRIQPQESGELILPSQRKYDESRKQPYMAYMDRLARILNSDHSLLISCGYGFGDEHINAILFGAIDRHSTANIVALQFSDLAGTDTVVTAGRQRSNLTVIGPNGGVISGMWGEWQLAQPVDNKTCSFLDTAFDSNASPETEGSAAAVPADLHGKMRLGDFNWLSRFLNAMGTP